MTVNSQSWIDFGMMTLEWLYSSQIERPLRLWKRSDPVLIWYQGHVCLTGRKGNLSGCLNVWWDVWSRGMQTRRHHSSWGPPDELGWDLLKLCSWSSNAIIYSLRRERDCLLYQHPRPLWDLTVWIWPRTEYLTVYPLYLGTRNSFLPVETHFCC